MPPLKVFENQYKKRATPPPPHTHTKSNNYTPHAWYLTVLDNRLRNWSVLTLLCLSPTLLFLTQQPLTEKHNFSWLISPSSWLNCPVFLTDLSCVPDRPVLSSRLSCPVFLTDLPCLPDWPILCPRLTYPDWPILCPWQTYPVFLTDLSCVPDRPILCSCVTYPVSLTLSDRPILSSWLTYHVSLSCSSCCFIPVCCALAKVFYND